MSKKFLLSIISASLILIPAISFGQFGGGNGILGRILLGGAPQQKQQQGQQQNSQATVRITGPSWCGPCETEWKSGGVPNVDAIKIVNSNGDAWIFPKNVFGNKEFLRPVDSNLVSKYGGIKTQKYQGSVPTTGTVPRSALSSPLITPVSNKPTEQNPTKPVVNIIDPNNVNTENKSSDRYKNIKKLSELGLIELHIARTCKSFQNYYKCYDAEGRFVASITSEDYQNFQEKFKQMGQVIIKLNTASGKGLTGEEVNKFIEDMFKKNNVGGGGGGGGVTGKPKITLDELNKKIQELSNTGKTPEQIRSEMEIMLKNMSDEDLKRLGK